MQQNNSVIPQPITPQPIMTSTIPQPIPQYNQNAQMQSNIQQPISSGPIPTMNQQPMNTSPINFVSGPQNNNQNM